MAANLEIDGLVVGVLHVPHHVNLVAGQLIAHGKVEMEGIDLHRLRVVVQAIHHLTVALGEEREVFVAGEAVARELILPSVDPIRVAPYHAHDREENRRAPSPISGIALPQILLSPIVLDA